MTLLLQVIPGVRSNHWAGPRRRSILPALLALVTLVLSAAGCGSSDNGVAAKPGEQILAAARTATLRASSVHVGANSKVLHGRPLELDASLAKNQGHARVTMFGLSFQVIRDGETLYVKGNSSFNARLEATRGVKIPPGKWLKGTIATTSLGQLDPFTDIKKELPVILGGSGKVTKGARVKIDGQPAIALKLTRKLYTGTLYVATTGEPYPLKLLKNAPGQTGLRETGQTTFSGWNDPVSVAAPANAIPISQLQHLKKRH